MEDGHPLLDVFYKMDIYEWSTCSPNVTYAVFKEAMDRLIKMEIEKELNEPCYR